MSINFEPVGEDLASAKAAFSSGRFPDAIRVCEELTRTDPTNYDAWELLGAAYAQSGHARQGMEAMRRCVQLRPNAPRAHFNLANVMAVLGDMQGARQELESCLAVDPTYQRASQALRQLGVAPGAAPVPSMQPAAPASPVIDRAPLGVEGPMIGQPPVIRQPPMIGQAPLFGQAATISHAPPIGQGPPPFTPGPGPAAYGVPPPGPAAAGGIPGVPPPARGTSYGLQAQHELPDNVAHWLKRAIWMGIVLTLASVGSLLHGSGSKSGEGTSAGQVALALLQIGVGGGMMTGATAVLNRKDWGRKLVQIFGVLGFILAVTALATMFTAGPVEMAAGSSTAVMGSRSIIRPLLWMFCCGFLVYQMNTDYVRMAMEHGEG